MRALFSSIFLAKLGDEMMVGYSRVFTLEPDGRPISAFEATGARQAQELCKEA